MNPPIDGASEAFSSFHSALCDALDRHAPAKLVQPRARQSDPWMSKEVRAARALRRRCEARWRSSGLVVHKQIYIQQVNATTASIKSAKRAYFTSNLSGVKNSQKELFSTFAKLTANRSATSLQIDGVSDVDLADRFAQYFDQKIVKIRNDLDVGDQTSHQNVGGTSSCTPTLFDFEPTSVGELKSIIKNTPVKTSSLDPIPASLLKDILPDLLPPIVIMINESLRTGVFPDEMKLAIITPLLKKQGADISDMKNYRPVSNLSYFSKLLERVVAARLHRYLAEHNLYTPNQSAYRPGHSVESALTSIADSVLLSLDRRDGVAMVLLDLSAAFDTIDHTILLARLRNEFGMGGSVLAWIESYLSGRTFKVKVGGSLSETHDLKFGVPQGSVLGPLLFSCYTRPLANIMKVHGLESHLFADDTQNWHAFKLTPTTSLPTVLGKIETCLHDVRMWMRDNKLKVNDLKTEFLLLISPPQEHMRPGDVVLSMGDSRIEPSTKCRNLGFIFDNSMTLHDQISSVVSAGFYHLRKIAAVKKYLPAELLTTLTHAFITSRLDFCNSLYVGLPEYELNRLQKLQNQAARLVTNTKRRDHITPVLRELHWLPVRARIHFKILTFAFRAVQGDGPAYLRLPLLSAPRTTRAGAAPRLAYCRAKKRTAGDRAYSVVAPWLWNKLPVDIRSCGSIITFKKLLKTYFFNQYFN